MTRFKPLRSPVSSCANVCVFVFEVIKRSSKKIKTYKLKVSVHLLPVHQGFAELVITFSLVFGGGEATSSQTPEKSHRDGSKQKQKIKTMHS